MRKKKTRPTRIGSKLCALLICFLLCVPALIAAKKEKRKEAAQPFALIAGTVYRPPGFALAGAGVVIEPISSEAPDVKLKKIEAVTDARGEWAVRIPPVPATWRVGVKMNGYRPEQRSVSVAGEQRVDLSIILEPVNQPPVNQPKEATQ